MTKYLDETGLKTLVTEVKKAIKAGDDKNIPTAQKGVANGVATLDSGGKIPIEQLGNLDTTVAEVVTSLPTTGIKKHIYMVKASSTSNQNIYKEYIYTGDINAVYDASKWEQLGEYKANVDLSDYYHKAEIQELYYSKSDINTNFYTKTESDTKYNQFKNILFSDGGNSSDGAALKISLAADKYGHGAIEANIPNVSNTLPGLMLSEDKKKLDGISSIESTEIESLF